MSLLPQGLFTFTGGITSAVVLSAEVTQTHSLRPDLCIVRIPLGSAPVSKNGDVTLEYEGETITLKNCTVDFVEQDVGDQLVWNVTILDRRWKWRDGAISGRYNVRFRNKTDLRPETRKTAEELAKLCLTAMGELDLSGSSTLSAVQEFPEINWFYDNPAEALQALCEPLGFRPVYDWSEDRVRIVQVGFGKDLDLDIPHEKDSLAYNPPELPGKIIVACAPSRWQYDFALLTKGLNIDGRILNLDDLAYHPIPLSFVSATTSTASFVTGAYDTGTRWDTKYWNALGVNPTFSNVRPPYYRQLALDSVFRWYQVFPPPSVPGLNRLRGDGKGASLETFPAWDDQSQTYTWQIELLSEQNDTILYLAQFNAQAYDNYNKLVSATPLDAWVYGNFASDIAFGNVLPDNPGSVGSGVFKLDPKIITSPQQILNSLGTEELQAQEAQLPDRLRAMVAAKGFYTGSFAIDSEHALVKFGEMVYQLFPFKTPNQLSSATDADGTPISPGSATVPAALWLRTAAHVRDPSTRALVCYERHRTIDPDSKTTRVFIREDLTYRLTYRPKALPTASGATASGPLFISDFDIEDNKQAIDKACDFYLDQIEQLLRTETPRTVRYIGLVPQKLDGAIRQVTWTINEEGARTYVARDTEILRIVRDFKEVRLRDRLNALLKARTKPEEPRPATTIDYSGLI